MTVRLFVSEMLYQNAQIPLNEMQQHYLLHVMRLKEGDSVLVFNGKEGEWLSRVEELNKKKALLRAETQTKQQSSSPPVWLCFAPVKNTDIIIQKATELGVSVLCPVITHRTVISKINTEKMHLQAIEASEQCERLSVPYIHAPIKLEALLEELASIRTIYFLTERQNGCKISKYEENSAFLVGPEGGFDEQEVERINAYSNVVPVHLGERILRAETACIASLVLWNQANGWK